jgi:hypothetical protein
MVFENRVLRRIFGSKGDAATGVWRKLHNEEFNDLYCTPTIVRVIKIENNEMGWACSMYGEGKGVYRFWWGKLRKRDHWGDPGEDGKLIMR